MEAIDAPLNDAPASIHLSSQRWHFCCSAEDDTTTAGAATTFGGGFGSNKSSCGGGMVFARDR